MRRHLPHPGAGEVPQVMNPLRFGEATLRVERAPPVLGQHTDEVLAGLGLSAEQIGDYRRRNII